MAEMGNHKKRPVRISDLQARILTQDLLKTNESASFLTAAFGSNSISYVIQCVQLVSWTAPVSCFICAVPQVQLTVLYIIEVFAIFVAGRPKRSSRSLYAENCSESYKHDAEEKAASIKQKFSRIRDIIDSDSD